jgi:hypothetical protein
MTENSNNKNTRNDEIDLLDLLKRIGITLSCWVRNIGRAFLISIVFLVKRWLPLAISLAAGIGISYVLKTTRESSFTTDMVLRNNTVSKTDKISYNADMISYINRLHALCKDFNYPALTKALSLQPDVVNNIKDIGAFWIIDKKKDGIPDEVDYTNTHNVYDTINVRMPDRIDIRVKIASHHELTLLQNSIITFINNDSLFMQRNRLRLWQNRDLLARLNYDILQLDSLQKVKYFEETRSQKPQTGGQLVFLQEQKTQLIYTDIYTLYSKKQALETERDLYPGIVTVLSDFSLPVKPDKGTLYYCKYIVPPLLLIAVVLLIIFANRKKIKEVYNKY